MVSDQACTDDVVASGPEVVVLLLLSHSPLQLRGTLSKSKQIKILSPGPILTSISSDF